MKLIFAKSFYTALLAASLLLLSQVATAHHSKALQFDMNSEKRKTSMAKMKSGESSSAAPTLCSEEAGDPQISR
jgi:hypothetical protein